MVTDNIKIIDKHRKTRKVVKTLLIIFVIFLVLLIAFAAGFIMKKPGVKVVLENPIAGIVLKYTNEAGFVDKDAVIQEAVIEFNEDYINYILVALGAGYLHKSAILPFEKPKIEFNLGGEVWNSEITKGMPNSEQGQIDDEDLIVSISKEEAVRALLSEDIEQFMKDSVSSGNTQIEVIAGKTELFSKGYLEMHKELTGEEISAE